MTQIKLSTKNSVLSKDKEMAELLDFSFKNAIYSLDIFRNTFLMNSSNHIDDPVQKSMTKYKMDTSILNIKQSVSCNTFTFKKVTVSQVMFELHKINPKKQVFYTAFLQKFLKSENNCVPQLQKISIKCIETCDFTSDLKLAEITPVFKRDDPGKPFKLSPNKHTVHSI